ncbi:hypothetical protein [Desulfocurvibacter africanus]|uniref:hypothetical protein n=1 Tax=Desulfocurvibacter africanus TaxID=873 RepID=UPI000401D7E0|nr:hypothetical protein [Desulfocurvibacter africanus]
MAARKHAEVLREHRRDAARLRKVGRLLLDRLEDVLASAGPSQDLGPGDLKSLARTHYEAASSLHKAIALERQACNIDDGEGAGGMIKLPGLTILITGPDGPDGSEGPDGQNGPDGQDAVQDVTDAGERD